MRTLIAAFRFLTRVPVPGPVTRSEDLPGSLTWFPLVGAWCNAAVAGLAVLAAMWWSPLIAAVLAVAFGLLLTGGFHEDAASDSADGLGGGGPDIERVLLIMKDSRVGAFGAMALWIVLAGRVAFLTALLAWSPLLAVAGFALAGAWGRWTAAPLLRLPPIATSGLSKDVSSGGVRVLPATMVVLALSAGLWWLGLERAGVAGLVAVGMCLIWGVYLLRRLGGQSGDLLGAGNLLVEAAVLLTLTAAP